MTTQDYTHIPSAGFDTDYIIEKEPNCMNKDEVPNTNIRTG